MRSAAAVATALLVMAAPALALPLDDYVTVQLIDVCNGTSAADSTRCAPVPIDPTKDLFDPVVNPVAATTEAIWKQAGISFNFLPTINKFYDGSFLQSFTDNTPTDQVHQLVRSPGHGQNAASRTLNVFFVDAINTPVGPVAGYGLVGSNGAVISATSNLDSIAHELGHNLGLPHASSDPANLMLSAGRNVPGSIADVLAGQTDQLTADQIAVARQPLFTVRGASATVTFQSIVQQEYQTYTLSADPNGTSEQLKTLKIRYLDAHSVLAGNVDELEISFGGTCFLNGSASLLNGTGASALRITSGNTLTISYYDKTTPITGGLEAVSNLINNCLTDRTIDFSLLANATKPFSFEFDFTDGATSTGLYDAATGRASTTDPITVGFIGQPTFGLGEAPPPEILDDTAEVFDIFVPVPEAPLPWLAGAFLLPWQLRRRTRRLR